MAVKQSKPPQRKTHLREWRLDRGLTLEVAAERIGENLRERGIASGYTHATLGRLERGLVAYTQPVLEAMADVYSVDLASLLMRNPSDPEGMWAIWDEAKQADRQKIVAIAKIITGKTATP